MTENVKVEMDNTRRDLSVLLLMLFILFCPSKANSQEKYPSLSVHQNDLKIVFHYCDSKIKPSDDVMYYWMKYRVVHTTEGGYAGQLLHGDYQEYFISGQLKTSGTFKKGAKEGQWKIWYENGKTEGIFLWKKGLLDGKFMTYYEDGKIKERGKYRNNTKHGVVAQFDKLGNMTKLRYRNGNRVDREAKKESRLKAKKVKEEKRNQNKIIELSETKEDSIGDKEKTKRPRRTKENKSQEPDTNSEEVSNWVRFKEWVQGIFKSKDKQIEND